MGGDKKKIIVSGSRATGKSHLGHLLGMIENWVALQDDYTCYYFVADWHGLMSEYKEPSKMYEYALDKVADWLACGLDPKKCVIFTQSDVPYHAELFLALAPYVPVSWLERCPTYKEQMQALAEKDVANYAFLGYPLLQTADIAVYKGELVPVGEDQAPHLEISREIVRRFNQFAKADVLPEPQPKFTKVPKLLGLDNRKMSNSYGNLINLTDDRATVEKLTLTMVTDPERIRLKDPGHPEVCNVFSYYKIFAPERTAEVEDWCRGSKKGCSECKKILSGHLNAHLDPIREKRSDIARADAEKILADGAVKANEAASRTMADVHAAIGMKPKK